MTPNSGIEDFGAPAIDLGLTVRGRRARLSSRIDEETLHFEEELSREVDIPLSQRQMFLAASPLEYRIFQMRDEAGKPAMQIALQIHRSNRLKSLSRAIATQVGRATNPAEELAALQMLRTLCTTAGDVMSLRLQAIRSDSAELEAFESRALVAGLSCEKPLYYTRTIMCSLEGTLEDIQMRMSKKTRPKLRHRTRKEIILKPLTDHKYQEQCRDALQAAFERTGGRAYTHELDTEFELARTHPDHVVILGIFMPDRPEQLLAFVVGRRGGEHAEYTAAGSLADPVLRKMPFNYFLLWELMQWAHQQGAKWLNLGGITPGGPDDPRASISDFKRHLCENEVEVSREVGAVIQPVRAYVYDRLSEMRQSGLRPIRNFATGLASATAVLVLLTLIFHHHGH